MLRAPISQHEVLATVKTLKRQYGGMFSMLCIQCYVFMIATVKLKMP